MGLYGASSEWLAGANKNFIGIVEVNNELPINPRPICGSTRLAFPGSFILASRSICQACAAPRPPCTTVAPRRCSLSKYAHDGLSLALQPNAALLCWPPGFSPHQQKKLIKGPDFNQVSQCTALVLSHCSSYFLKSTMYFRMDPVSTEQARERLDSGLASACLYLLLWLVAVQPLQWP